MDQLKREVGVTRIKTSVACNEIINFVLNAQKEDFLASNDAHVAKADPFDKKKGLQYLEKCTLI